MTEPVRSVEAWVKFAGFVLVVGVLYWAQAVLVPVCLAILLTFVLTPPVLWLQRRIGRLAAILTVVIVVFSVLGLAAYGVYRQTASLMESLPAYTENIRTKIRDVRGMQSGGSVEKLSKTIEEIKDDLGTDKPPTGTGRAPVVVAPQPSGRLWAFDWLGPIIDPLTTAGFVITLVLFMLLDRERLRDRLVGLFGHGHLALATKAMDEAGRRVSQQLLLQTLVNVIYGTLAIAGLYLIGVPYPLFWGVTGAALRFIPYVGPIAAAGGPILMGLATLPGWTRPLEVVGFYTALELFTNLVLETVLYAEAAGISQVALLVAVAFWTWLWGPLGLVMATPLTVCIIVIGKHVPGLDFLGTLLSDAPALTSENRFYQRLLAGDQVEAEELLEEFVRAQPVETVYDAMLVPALNYAERDRLEERLSAEEEAAVVETTREMLGVLAEREPEAPSAPVHRLAEPLRVLGYPVNGTPDELALRMLGQLLAPLGVQLDIAGARLMGSELIAHVREQGYPIVCLADLPPSSPSKSRYLVKKMRAALPEVRIAVGRWAPAELADETLEPLTSAGASHVAATLLETRRFLWEAGHVAAPVTAVTPDAA